MHLPSNIHTCLIMMYFNGFKVNYFEIFKLTASFVYFYLHFCKDLTKLIKFISTTWAFFFASNQVSTDR